MSKRRKYVKARKIMSKSDKRLQDKAILYNKVKKLSTKANSRLKTLKRAGFKKDSWAGKQLFDRIGNSLVRGINRKNKTVKVSKSMSTGQLRVIGKALSNFLEAETSTPKGIKASHKKAVETFKNTISGQYGGNLTYEEAETIQLLFNDSDFNYLCEQIGGSDPIYFVADAIERGDTKEEFFERMKTYFWDLKDEDLRKRTDKVYKKIKQFM